MLPLIRPDQEYPRPLWLKIVRVLVRLILAAIMVTIGIVHFVTPGPFESIVPSALPDHRLLVLVSGFFEVLGGVGLLLPVVNRAAAWGLVALYVAVFPANINMAVHNIPIDGHHFPLWELWLRLPLQIVLIVWAGWLARESSTPIRKNGTF